MAGKTFFHSVCQEWLEWKPPRPGATLKYEYRVKPKGADRAMLFYYGYNPYNTPAMLPLGNPEYDMLTEVEISVVDSVFDSVKIILNVTV